jgi:hypothetical protein
MSAANSHPTPDLPDGLVAVVKRSCPTCEMIAPVLAQIAGAGVDLTVVSQDDPGFPAGLEAVDDRTLELSYRLKIDIVPTLLRLDRGAEAERAIGWRRDEWETLSGVGGLGPELVSWQAGCGSLSVEPGVAERLEARYGTSLEARRVELGSAEDEHEALFERGWTDGLPAVPPTPERVLRMLGGTDRPGDEVVGTVPPNMAPCSVEKAAINAVMAGCKPEYFPVVLGAVEAACRDEFGLHGLLATTMSHGPVAIVNGPLARRIGMGSGINLLGQGNRANSTIGRALQLVVRNVGGGRPGEVDRATFGNPGKIGLCFAEDEEGSPWEPLSVERGFPPGASTVTLFGGEGPRLVVDQLSRAPESLAASFAACLKTVIHPKLPLAFDALLVVSPEHARVFRDAGWSKARLRRELMQRLMLPGAEIARGAGGVAEGVPEEMRDQTLPKFRPGGLLIVHAGGSAGLFSAIIGGWVNGEMGTNPVTVEIHP